MCWASTKKNESKLCLVGGQNCSHGPNMQLHQYTSISKSQNITRQSKRKYIWEYDCTFSFKIRTCMYVLNIFKKKPRNSMWMHFANLKKKFCIHYTYKKCIVKKAIHHTVKTLYIKRSCSIIVNCYIQ